MTDRLFPDHLLLCLDEEERAMATRVRALCRDTLGPQAAAVAQRDVFAWDTFRTLAREGVVGTAFPREYGGSDARQVLRIRIIEELGRVCSTSASIITGTDLSARAVVAGASAALRAELLPRLCTGEIQTAFALTESGAGSDVRGLQSVARRDGDYYVLNGGKKFITRATTADWLMVIARLEGGDGAKGAVGGGFVGLLVPRDAPGVNISAEVGKLGWFGVPISTLAFRDVRVPATHRLGEEGDGLSLAQDALLRARIGHAAMALGRAIGAVEIASTYACERSTFGQPLASHQGVQWMLADMVTQIEASRALLFTAAQKYDRGDADTAMFASMAKLHATDLCMKVVTDSLQLTGGRGYLQDFPLERFFRDAKLNQIGEGASEVHKSVIGRDVARRAATAERNPCLRDGPLADY